MKKETKNILIIYLLSKILILTVYLFFKKDLLEIFDALHYLTIAKEGYTSDFLYAFFPLYPFLIRLLHYIIPSYKICGILISNIANFFSLLMISKLTTNNKKKILYFILFFSNINL